MGIAEQNNLRFIPAVFPNTGQIHDEFELLVKEQVRQKLIAFEGEAKRSKVRSSMKWWFKCISLVTAKTASRNVTFKAVRMRDSIMEGQDEFIMRQSDSEDVGLGEDYEAVLEDIGCNADLYIANQENNTDPFCFQLLSLD